MTKLETTMSRAANATDEAEDEVHANLNLTWKRGKERA